MVRVILSRVSRMLVGVVSDTHGYLNPKLPELLRGVEHTLHAGDVGKCAVVEQLERIAPVTVVRGNVDREGKVSLYPEEATLELGGRRIYLTHQVKVPKEGSTRDMEPYIRAEVDVVVFGHSHIAFQDRRGKVLFFNPGAAGKRRFKVVPSIGFLDLAEDRAVGTIVPL